MPGNFQLLDHPSDIGICATASTREGALVALSEGLTSILADPEKIRPVLERPLRVDGLDALSQVVNWLNEILFYYDAEGLLFSQFVVETWTSQGLIGRARGEHVDLSRHVLRTAVKAATYHQFEISQPDGGWQIRVFIDV